MNRPSWSRTWTSSLFMSLISTRDVKKYTLQNGLTVLLETNHASPVVSFNVGVKIGSVWETDAEAGLSHVLEHMVFKGTASTAPGEIAKIVEGCGGELNAYTSLDQTVYYINLASRHWKTGLKLIKEMVCDALIDAEELKREQEVIVEELRRGKDNPHSLLSEILFGLAFKTHPYGRPVIGFEKTVRSFSQNTVLDFYRRWYTPSNMVLGICGDFDEEEIRRAVEEAFGRKNDTPVNRPAIPPESSPASFRFRASSSPVVGHYLSLAFPIPAFGHPDIAALDLLSHYLGGGETSRLNQMVKEEKKLASSIHSQAYTPTFPGLLVVSAIAHREHLSEIFPAIAVEIEACRVLPMPEDMLARAKQNLVASILYEKETCEGTARKWMVYETTIGDFRYEEEYLRQVEKVTPQNILDAANKYLRLEMGAAVTLHSAGEKGIEVAFHGSKKTKGNKKPYAFVEEFEGIKKYRLKNGLTVITRANHRLPLVSVRLLGLGGLRLENSSSNGMAHLTTSLLEKGTHTKKALRIAEMAEEISGSVGGSAGKNSWGVSLDCLAKKRDAGLDLFCDLIKNPSFEEEEIMREKKVTLEQIKNQEDSLSHLSFLKFNALLYQKHPYGLPLLGTRQTVPKLTRNRIFSYYRSLLDPQKMVIAATGDFDEDDLLEPLTQNLASLAGKFGKLKLAPLKPVKSVRQMTLKKKKMQAHIVLGYLATTISNPDRYPFEVLNNILAGQGGRLFLELRDKNSLAYSITSVFNEGVEAGYFAAYIGTEPSKVKAAIAAILREFQLIRDEPVSNDELDRAKNYIIGNHEIDLQRNSAVAGTLAFNELFGYPMAEFRDFSKKIAQVSADQVHQVALKYLRPNAHTLVIIKP